MLSIVNTLGPTNLLKSLHVIHLIFIVYLNHVSVKAIKKNFFISPLISGLFSHLCHGGITALVSFLNGVLTIEITDNPFKINGNYTYHLLQDPVMLRFIFMGFMWFLKQI